VLVEAFVAHPALEALGEGVLRRLAGRDVAPVPFALLGELQDGRRRELGPVVADDDAGPAAPGDQLLEFADDALARQGGVGDAGQG
jgi:hypothetical protein